MIVNFLHLDKGFEKYGTLTPNSKYLREEYFNAAHEADRLINEVQSDKNF